MPTPQQVSSVLLLLLATVSALAVTVASSRSTTAVIVRLSAPATLVANPRAAANARSAQPPSNTAVTAQQKAFRAQVKKDLGLNCTVRHSFSLLTNAISLNLPTANLDATLTALQQWPQVVSAERVKYIRRPVLIQSTKNATNSRSDAYANALTGVDLVQTTLNITGKGIRLAIIDDGVDWRHPDLGGCFGPGCKVAFGYDFTGDDPNNPTPGPDPRTTCSGHGTHVSGIAGAKGKVTGVAPDVTLGMYRVFPCGDGGTSDDLVLSALERAVLDKADIVSLSLGINYDWSDPNAPNPREYAMMAQLGIYVVAAGGNGGPGDAPFPVYGVFGVNTPSVYPTVTSVAASENSVLYYPTITFAACDQIITYIPFNSGSFPYLDPNVTGKSLQFAAAAKPSAPTDQYGPVSDSCQASDVSPRVRNKVAVIMSGGCDLTTKYFNALQAGAVAVLIYDRGADPSNPLSDYSDVTDTTIPSGFTDHASGLTVLGCITSNKGSGTFNLLTEATLADSGTAGSIAGFSTLGPSITLDFKPEIAAPGDNILSTVPVNLGSYDSYSGTSMATPYIAGAAALMLQAHPGQKPDQIKTIFMNTATPLLSAATPGAPAPANQQGAGQIDVLAAISLPSVTVTPHALPLGATAIPYANTVKYTSLQRTISIQNSGPSPLTFDISHQPTPTQIYDIDLSISGTEILEYATATFSAAHVRVPAQSSASFRVTFAPPTNAPPLAIFSGFVVLTPKQGSGMQVYSVPYNGLNGNYQSLKPVNGTVMGSSDIYGDFTPGPFRQKAFSMQGNDYPAQYVYLRGAARAYVTRVYRQEHTTYLYTIDYGTFFAGADQNDGAVFVTGDVDNPDPSGPVRTCSLPDGNYYFKTVITKPLAAVGNGRLVQNLQTPNFSIKRTKLPANPLCLIGPPRGPTKSGLTFPTLTPSPPPPPSAAR